MKNFKRTVIDDHMYTVYPIGNTEQIMYNQGENIAIEFNGYAYPLRNRRNLGTGVYPIGNDFNHLIEVMHPTTEEEKEKYRMHSENTVDFSNIENIQELTQTRRKLATMESTILSNPDNIFTPLIQDSNFPEMRILKQAVSSKHIDIDKYAGRFGANFNNDKRIFFNDDSISLKKMKRICDNLDLKLTLQIEDIDPNVPNPMGKNVKFEAQLTGLGENYDDDEK